MRGSVYDSDAIRLLSAALKELLAEARISARSVSVGGEFADRGRAVSRKLMAAYDAGTRDLRMLKYAGRDAAMLRAHYDAASIAILASALGAALPDFDAAHGRALTHREKTSLRRMLSRRLIEAFEAGERDPEALKRAGLAAVEPPPVEPAG